MKKITTSLFLILFSFIASAQFEFKKSDGTLIQNGDVLTFGPNNNYLNFRIKNTSNQPLDIKVKCTNLVNTDGTQFELCYGGSCFESVAVNGIYPNYENLLAPGQSSPAQGEHFANFNNGNGQIIDLEFSVYALGFENNVINFTYRYNPLLNSSSFEILENMGINLKNTVIDSNLNFDSNTNGYIFVYNLRGQLVSKSSFSEGTQNINFSNLSPALYLIRFSTNDGRIATSKVLKN